MVFIAFLCCLLCCWFIFSVSLPVLITTKKGSQVAAEMFGYKTVWLVLAEYTSITSGANGASVSH